MFAKIRKHVTKISKNVPSKELNVFGVADFVDSVQDSLGATSDTDHIEGVEEVIRFRSNILSVDSDLHHRVQLLCGFLRCNSTLKEKTEKKKLNLNKSNLKMNNIVSG